MSHLIISRGLIQREKSCFREPLRLHLLGEKRAVSSGVGAATTGNEAVLRRGKDRGKDGVEPTHQHLRENLVVSLPKCNQSIMAKERSVKAGLLDLGQQTDSSVSH
jgi:hypothetical protein